MRCLACNVELNNVESTRKSRVTGEYLDLCNPCFGTIQEDVKVEPEMGDEDELDGVV